MTRLSVVTVTYRREPRLIEMAATLAESAQRAGAIVQWVIYDERLAERDTTALRAVARNRLEMVHVQADPHPLRVPGPTLRPAHASARNAALRLVTGNYVVFLDDCTLVTADWVKLALEIARSGRGWRCYQRACKDLPVQLAYPLQLHVATQDRIGNMPASVVGGTCWGAPLAAILEVGGFDTVYDGAAHGFAQDLALRMERKGLRYCTCRRAVAIQVTRTATHAEITSAIPGQCYVHIPLLAALAADRTRTSPAAAAAPASARVEPGATDAARARQPAASPRVAAARPAPGPRHATAAEAPDAAPAAPVAGELGADPVAPIEVVVVEHLAGAEPPVLEAGAANGASSKRKRKPGAGRRR